MYEETSNDLSIKHDNTYIGIKDKEEDCIAILREFYNDQTGYKTIKVRISKFQNGTWNAYEHYWCEVEPDFILEYPQMGAINLENSVLLLRRKLKLGSPSRYRKTLRKESFTWFDPNLLERELLSMETYTNLSSSLLLSKVGKRLFFRQELTSEEAISCILSNSRIGAAFSEHYYYTLNSCNNTISLWRSDNIIGTYNPIANKFDMNTVTFNEELTGLGVRL